MCALERWASLRRLSFGGLGLAEEDGVGHGHHGVGWADRAGSGIAELVQISRARPASPFALHAADVTYLGSGPVQIQIQPSSAQANLIDKLSTKLGMPLETWMPPLLNVYLPGLKEPDNMPWLTREPGKQSLP